MTARDDLLREMTAHHLYMTDERAEELVNAFAHELGNRIRAAVEADDDTDLRADGYGDYRNVLHAADLIDPQAN